MVVSFLTLVNILTFFIPYFGEMDWYEHVRLYFSLMAPYVLALFLQREIVKSSDDPRLVSMKNVSMFIVSIMQFVFWSFLILSKVWYYTSGPGSIR